jgi:hypothetical protein
VEIYGNAGMSVGGKLLLLAVSVDAVIHICVFVCFCLLFFLERIRFATFGRLWRISISCNLGAMGVIEATEALTRLEGGSLND